MPGGALPVRDFAERRVSLPWQWLVAGAGGLMLGAAIVYAAWPQPKVVAEPAVPTVEIAQPAGAPHVEPQQIQAQPRVTAPS